MFCCRKKKKNYALMIIAIVMASLAAAAGAYVLFTKVLKGKIGKKQIVDENAECEEINELPEGEEAEAEVVAEAEADVAVEADESNE